MLYLNLLIALQLFAPIPTYLQVADCTIITNQRDTISGIFVSADQVLTIRPVWDKRHLVLHPHQIFEYALMRPDGTQDFYQFITMPGTNTIKPMRRLVDGDLKLFEHKEKQVSAVNPGLPKGASVPPKASIFYIGSYSEDVVRVTAQSWKAILKTRLQDCPALVKNLGQRGYRFSNLPSIVAAYNVCHQR